MLNGPSVSNLMRRDLETCGDSLRLISALLASWLLVYPLEIMDGIDAGKECSLSESYLTILCSLISIIF